MSDAVPPSRPGLTALVVSQFPRYVDAYFLREVSALAARGVRLRIFSLLDFDGGVVHERARPLLPLTTYAPFLFSRRIVLAQLRALTRTPGRYLGALWSLIRGCWRSPRALMRSLAVFPKTVHFAHLMTEEGVTHIHANWATHPAAAAWVASRLTGIRWSFAGHASDIYLERAMLAEKLSAAAFVVTCTRQNRDYLAGIAGPAAAGKIVVSYHGVDLAQFEATTRREGDRLRIVAVGTLIACKGFDDLVAACGLLRDRGVAHECVIVGDGPERRSLETLVAAKGLEEQVTLSGYVSQEALVPLYQQADVIALPARSDEHFGIPNVLLEAMACGAVPVCTRLPSMPEVMEDGVQGLYVPERDPAALAAALERLAQDRARCRAMGVEGRRAIQTLFDLERNVATLEGLLGAARPAVPSPGTTAGLGAEPGQSMRASEPASVKGN
jgi:glycosyltransferase involved in cell wall biosynthesis